MVLLAKDIKNLKNVENIAAKIQKKAKQPLQIGNNTFSMCLSIGIAIYPEHGTIDQELLKNADIAMYEVKENGRNNFKIYENIMGRKILTKTSMIGEIKRALIQKDFVMYYQPVIDFQTKRVVGAEALIRWIHPYRGIISPADFLHYILSSDMEEEFGDFVVESVMQDIQKLNNLFPGHEICIAINITREHFFTPSFCADMATMIQKYGVKSSQVEMEILEMQIMHNTEIAKENIDNLRHMGFKISLDDFGVEYSSLNYLKHFHVDKLKVDKSFIHNIHEGEQDLRIVQSIINIGKVFDLKVQAEGVETLEQYNKIKEFGCDFSQGYYHSRPIGFEEFICYYKESTKKDIA